MSVTTTDNPVTSTISETLQDYEIHLTGEQDLPPRHVWVPLTDHSAPPVDNPQGWEDSFRGVPNYRPVNTELDRASRPWGSNAVESGFVFLMLNGVWLTGSRPEITPVTQTSRTHQDHLQATKMEVQTPPIRDISSTVEDTENELIFHKNVSVPLKASSLPIRANVYLPLSAKSGDKFPVLVTYGPYGKDIPYETFFNGSFNQVNLEHRSKYSAWETPDPVFWTKHGYAIVRADERGLGQSPGFLDTMSKGTSECFFDVVEWAAEQSWSTGKVGLLGISYYAGTQWRVAARKPKGLAAIIPWEGMSDYYRDRCQHGGILSNKFIGFWWNRQVLVNQYGKPGRSKLQFPPDGPGARGQEDTIEGDLAEDILAKNRQDQTIDNAKFKYRDDDYYASKEFDLGDIEVPLLSVANWGGILLHLRGNVEGYTHAGSKFKYLRFITGRHDLPFYYKEEVELQKSFLDAFLKGEDRVGWSEPGKVAPVTVTLRKGDVGFNDAEKEKAYPRREEEAWPIPRTQYTKFYLSPDQSLSKDKPSTKESKKVSYKALGSLDKPEVVSFTTAPFEEETEFTGHITAHLNVSLTPDEAAGEKDIDLFVSLRHLDASDKEIHYTGTAGDPVPLTKGWLRVSFRKVHTENPRNRPYLPHREYFSTDVLPVKADEVYPVEVEIWPSNVVIEKGSKLVFEIASGDTQGSGIFQHCSETDRPASKFAGQNHIHFGEGLDNYITLPFQISMAYSDHFSVANLPYGIASTLSDVHSEKAVATRVADKVIFLADLSLDVTDQARAALKRPTLNDLASLSQSELGQIRQQLKSVFSDESVVEKYGFKLEEVVLHLPVTVAGFTDYSCSKEHVLNAGEAVMGKRSMPPAFLYYPVGYSGTSSTIVVSGTPVQRPNGMYRAGETIEFGASRGMDYELELAAIIGKPTRMGESVKLEDADDHIFGIVLLNDWSSRDIQGFEMSPLGPMNGKSFSTSMSPWVVTLDALEPFATAAPTKELPVAAFLHEKKEKASYNIQLEAELIRDNQSTKLCTSNVSWMYWTFRDLVVQKTVNGCNLNTGDILATGTVSGAGDDEHGCLLEMTKGGKVEFALADGTKRSYLQDGDGVRMTAYCGDGVGFGECTGLITPAKPI
ncbi:X-Pro dipeptidyl-peptidase C-terminal non-catalytic domain-containing protein [Seiridium cupressi]